MSDIAKECVQLVGANLVLIAIAFWVFDSQAARFAVFAVMVGFTASVVVRLIMGRRRATTRKSRT